ncbi:MAG: hypothetical protein QM820_56075 [Minicystis sp.]
MRPLTSLAAVAVLAAASSAGAYPSIPVGRSVAFPPDGPAPRESAQVRFTPADGAETVLSVEVDVTYPRDVPLPEQDILYLGKTDPTDIEARDGDGRPLVARLAGDHAIVVNLRRPDEPVVRRMRLRFQQAVPAIRRYAWRNATAEIDLSNYAIGVTRDVTTTVVLSESARLPGFACRRDGDQTACSRTTPHRMEPFPLVLRARTDVVGMALLATTTIATIFGFAYMARKRAREIVEATRVATPPPDPDRPGGAYRAPPAKTLGAQAVKPPPPEPPAGDASESLGRLATSAVGIAALTIGSTIVVALIASGRSPWPMPSVTAAWVAVAGFIAALVVERSG